eukprot:TRINITY_DN8615_c0_g1_i1.p1 TRINITY_DN8615_c0_g1~~TRINITY_DN8615_c0_g1_i1.p1  ORF type:complete len:491 (-),score=284.53 TRINITY_DN8615_c0_g1_i1:157-1629(-)
MFSKIYRVNSLGSRLIKQTRNFSTKVSEEQVKLFIASAVQSGHSDLLRKEVSLESWRERQKKVTANSPYALLFDKVFKEDPILEQRFADGEISPNQFLEIASKDPSNSPFLRIINNEVVNQLRQENAAIPTSNLKPPVRVAVTGAAGAIGYALIFRIASGQLLGPNQPVILHLIELPGALQALQGVIMEVKDCAFPLVKNIIATSDLSEGFKGVNYALLVGSKPRSKGMERADLLKENGAIFSTQGKALNSFADRNNVKIVVVGNPANTNALIAAANAPDINPENFSALTRLDHNRGLAQIADKTNCSVSEIERFTIWGNHSPTMYPDLSHTTINGKSVKSIINDQKWIESNFIPAVQQRGTAIINARGASSAASAANATVDHIRDWALGTENRWTSMAVITPSFGNYGVTSGLFYSYPVTCSNGKYTIIQNLPIDEFSASKMQISQNELLEERKAVADYLPKNSHILKSPFENNDENLEKTIKSKLKKN